MRGFQVSFYADPVDMAALFVAFNDTGRLTYTETLSGIDSALVAYGDAMELLGFAKTKHPQAANVFLVTEPEVGVCAQEIRMRDGSGLKLWADQVLNPDAVLICLGGMVGQALIETTISTTGETELAKRLFKRLKKIVVNASKYGGGFYVMDGAMEKLRDGWRLTQSVEASTKYDLKLSDFEK